MGKHSESSHVGEIFFALCKSVDTPISLGLWLRFKHNQLALAEFELPIRDYLDAESFRLDYVVSCFLSKFKGLNTGLDLEAEALRRFTSSEVHCAETNRRLREARKKGIDPFISAVLFTAKRKIARLLGPWSLFCIDTKFGWGPGATNDVSRRRAFVDIKMSELPISTTLRARPLARGVIETDLHWSSVVLGVDIMDLVGPYCLLDNVFDLTEECVIDTVEKNAKTHRVIAKEPRANGFLQKGVGGYIRSRLKRVGVDLDDQGRNQEGASRAFEDRLATLDLKAASDSMSRELIFELLPFDWADALDAMRSPKAEMPDGSVITLQKFSSMGNGFTFELESLIFWAISSSVLALSNEVGGTEVLVYGDDIIVPAAKAAEVIAALEFIGFSINKDKSFVDGMFFESCGEHFFGGVNVTPVYQKEPIHFDPETVRCGNRILRLAYRFGSGFQFCKELLPAWRAAWRRAGPTSVFQLPFGATGDDGWVLPASEFAQRPQDVNLGLKCVTFRPAKQRFPAHDAALLAWTLRRGVVTEAPYQGYVTSSPETTTSASLIHDWRWVMPSGEFGLEI